MDTALVIADLNRAYEWELAPVDREEELEKQLAAKINVMIQRDFGTLVQLLYRVDVGEEKLRWMLEENSGEDAGKLIARLIIERQWQKIETRRQYRSPDKGPADEETERW